MTDSEVVNFIIAEMNRRRESMVTNLRFDMYIGSSLSILANKNTPITKEQIIERIRQVITAQVKEKLNDPY